MIYSQGSCSSAPFPSKHAMFEMEREGSGTANIDLTKRSCVMAVN